jgi:hypothetical protein
MPKSQEKVQNIVNIFLKKGLESLSTLYFFEPLYFLTKNIIIASPMYMYHGQESKTFSKYLFSNMDTYRLPVGYI